MMKKCFITIIAFISFCSFKAIADEGMWLPMLIDRLNYIDMQKMGLHLTADEIYSINHSSLKDAIVQFGGGCTSEVISPDGLMITNYHCGYNAIQDNSSVDHDYLSHGFWSKNKNEELKCPGLTAKFLIRMENVTPKVLSQLKDTMSEASRLKKVLEIAKQLQAEATKGTQYEAEVKGFFNGNEYYMFVYETFKDIRLVGTPPESLGKFGGDTDNWMWPRHTCDFSMFRIYTAPDGSPAEYSSENIPFKSKYFLPVSTKGIKNGDFTMVMGYPGSTDRFLTSFGVKMAIEKLNPSIVKIRDKKLALMKEDMNTSEAIHIKYAAKYAGTANYWKYFIGQTKNLKQLKVYDNKVEIEKQFTDWVNKDANRQAAFGKALSNISYAYVDLNKYVVARIYFSEALTRGTEIIAYSKSFQQLYDSLKAHKSSKSNIDKLILNLKNSADKYFKDYNAPTDKKLLTAMLTMYYNDIPKDQQPKVITDIADKYGKDFTKFADKVFDNSLFRSRESVNDFLKDPGTRKLDKDIVFSTMKELYAYAADLNKKLESINALLEKGNRRFVKGLMEMQPDKKFYPNANSTMRLTYGKVMDYFPADAVHYDFETTLKGVMEKEDPNNDEFIVPDKINTLYDNKDFGQYGDNGKLTTCFITNNDITGGNSGSPVINADGELIGLAFDGNWEAMSGNIAYNPDLQRCICVDIRYVLFIIDKFAGAKNLIQEMRLVSEVKPLHISTGMKPGSNPNHSDKSDDKLMKVNSPLDNLNQMKINSGMNIYKDSENPASDPNKNNGNNSKQNKPVQQQILPLIK